jgi:hypothetical protein
MTVVVRRAAATRRLETHAAMEAADNGVRHGAHRSFREVSFSRLPGHAIRVRYLPYRSTLCGSGGGICRPAGLLPHSLTVEPTPGGHACSAAARDAVAALRRRHLTALPTVGELADPGGRADLGLDLDTPSKPGEVGLPSAGRRGAGRASVAAFARLAPQVCLVVDHLAPVDLKHGPDALLAGFGARHAEDRDDLIKLPC